MGELNLKLNSLFRSQMQSNESILIKWVDSDGDNITVGNSKDWEEACSEDFGATLKLFVSFVPKSATQTQTLTLIPIPTPTPTLTPTPTPTPIPSERATHAIL